MGSPEKGGYSSVPHSLQKAVLEFIKTHPGVHFLLTCASQRDFVLKYASTEVGYFNGLLLFSSRLALKRHLENVSLEKIVSHKLSGQSHAISRCCSSSFINKIPRSHHWRTM